MKKRIRKWIAVLLSAALISGELPALRSLAVSTDEYDIQYYVPGKGILFSYVLDDALKAAYETPGVEIVVRRDREIDLPDFVYYRELNANTRLIVALGATLTINKHNFLMNGTLRIQGTVDLEHSEGLLYGNGRIEINGHGKLKKRPYDIRKKGDICLQAKDISYGQKLSEATITTDRTDWIPSIEGNWRFCDEDYVPQAGTRCHDVMFVPKYPLTYETKVFEKSGQVTTKQAVPKLAHYEKPEIHVGENLLDVHPQVSFVNPVTEECVEGEFSFEQSDQGQNSTGEQEVKGTFVPKDSNYVPVTQYYKVDVRETEPLAEELPVIRNQGTYGQTLGDIRFLPGKCTNPYTGKTVKGSWEWKDSGERLMLGNKCYKMIFVPEEEGYKRVEIECAVNTLPKVMENITWPECSDLVYGQALSDSVLSFTKNEYGTFAWKNENIRPEVKNLGADIVFTPASTDTYDWSRLAGYDEATGTVTFRIPVQVHSIDGELPEIQAAGIQEGTCVSGSALSLKGMEGKLEWEEPEKIAEKSGWYNVYYTPNDSSNYDWSAYSPGEDGRIKMKVYLSVTPNPEKATAAPEPTPTDGEETPEPTPTGGEETPEPTPTGGEETPEPTPTDGEETPEPTPTGGEETPEPTPTDAGQDPPPSPAGQPGKTSSSVNADKKNPGSAQAAVSSTEPSYIITQLVSRASTITAPAPVKRTSITKVKRMGKKVRLSWKKVAGAGYQLQYGTDRRMKKKKKLSVRKNSVTITGLKRGRTYYVRIRAWKKKGGRKKYGKWCKIKKIAP